MHWRLNKYVMTQVVKTIRRILHYNSQWTNKDIEIIQYASGSAQKVQETSSTAKEKYPNIVITPKGGNFTHSAFNNLVNVYDADEIVLGTRNLNMTILDGTNEFLFKLPTSIQSEKFRGLRIRYAWTGQGIGGDDIDYTVFKNYTTSPVVAATGALPGSLSNKFDLQFAEIPTPIELDSDDCWIQLQSTDDSPYYLGLDLNYESLISINGSPATGSVIGGLILPAFARLGGNFDGSVSIKVEHKNDTETVYNLVEIISLYLEFLKHVGLDRGTTAIDGTQYPDANIEIIETELLEKGIFFRDISIGPLETRRRGENDIIFGQTITFNFMTEWFQDYPLDSLQGIDIQLQTFFQDFLSEETSVIV